MLLRRCTLVGVSFVLACQVPGWGGPADNPPARPLAAGGLREAPRLAVNEARAAELGIRKRSGKHIRLFTDLPSGEEVDALPEVFDQAFRQWCAYFGVDAAAHADWKVTGFLMKD